MSGDQMYRFENHTRTHGRLDGTESHQFVTDLLRLTSSALSNALLFRLHLIGTSDQSCWLAEACKILLLLLST